MENLDKYRDYLLLRNMSDSTINSYVNNITVVSQRINKQPTDITEFDLVKYIVGDKKRKLSSSSQALLINSFKSFFKIIHDREFDKKILPRPKVEQRQPDILSVSEIQELLDCIVNIKHKAIIALMYSGALRVSEVINLKLKDIDYKNNKINIRQAKGKIDRFIPLSNKILKLLVKYFNIYRTKEYLFEGATGNQYSKTSIQNIVKSKVKKLGITKSISTHSIRHSSITHMIKSGVNLRVVQKIAGHKNINTTAGYIKIYDNDIMDIVNPIENIDL